jgi:hypothetical protein
MKKLSLPDSTRELLLEGESWVAYTLLKGLAESRSSAGRSAADGPGAAAAELEAARRASVSSALVRGLVKELGSWPGEPIASHKSANQAFHRLALAAELGLRRGDPGAEALAAEVMRRRSPEGPFALPMKIGEAYGGSGQEELGWALCDAPVILRALARMGWAEEPSLVGAVAYLVGLRLERGWPCAVSATLGGFRGPGKKADPCPYATLAMLELLLELPAYRGGPEIRAAASCLLGLWEHSRDEHPYIFYMGSDFRKLKAPLVWYDLLHVLEALSKVEGLEGDRRLGEMLELLASKAGPDLLFTPESVYQAWKGYDFGQKKSPSAYLSAIALGVLARTGRLNGLPPIR